MKVSANSGTEGQPLAAGAGLLATKSVPFFDPKLTGVTSMFLITKVLKNELLANEIR